MRETLKKVTALQGHFCPIPLTKRAPRDRALAGQTSTRSSLLFATILALALMLSGNARAAGPSPTLVPATPGLRFRGAERGLFERPELGFAFHVAPFASPFGYIGGFLVIAPVPYLTFEPGVAQRVEERIRPIGLMRWRFLRSRTGALSVGIGLDHRSRYEPSSFSCMFDEYKCGRHAANVWALPAQITGEGRMTSGVTFRASLGVELPVYWSRCERFEDGEVVGNCVPLLGPYLELGIGWGIALGRGGNRQRGVAP